MTAYRLSSLGIGLSIVFSLFSCVRSPIKNASEALRLRSAPNLSDDLQMKYLDEALLSQIEYLKKNSEASLLFGDKTYSAQEYISSLEKLLTFKKDNSDAQAVFEYISRNFDFFEVFGQRHWGDVFLTSYFEAVIPGSLKRTKKFSQPLYSQPKDILNLDLSLFDPKFAELKKYRARISDKNILPYFSREEIDVQKKLSGKNLEICFVDPIDAFILQIQGSGTVELPDNKQLHLNYIDKNGQSYESIGKFLKDKIPPENLNLQSIEAFLRTLPEKEMQEYLNKNPSYVFFKTDKQRALTFINQPAIDGRTIATDKRYFPKGAMAFLTFDKPKADDKGLPLLETEPGSRFVVDQDIGGAIQGPGRADLFWGRGVEAKLYAGLIKSYGKLYYLAPKK